MRTLGDGSFELSHLSPGAHSLRITAPGYGPEWTAAVEVSEGEWAAVTAMLVRLSGGGALEGRVTRRDGAPWVGAQLVVALMDQTVRPQMNFAPVRADADGRYHVEDLPPTFLLAILVDLAGGPPTVKPVEIVAGRTAVIDFLGDAAGVRLAGRVAGRK